MQALSREESRKLDRWAIDELGIPSVILMENAGRGIAELLLKLRAKDPVVICCGKGNNGGDGFVIARHLSHRRTVSIVLFADESELTGDAQVQFNIIARCGIRILHAWREPGWRQEINTASWIVDALFGTGLDRPMREPMAGAVKAINASPATVLAVDIPSGLDADSGVPLGASVVAEHTATMVAPKVGFTNEEAQQWLGKVHIVPIGLPKMDLFTKCVK